MTLDAPDKCGLVGGAVAQRLHLLVLKLVLCGGGGFSLDGGEFTRDGGESRTADHKFTRDGGESRPADHKFTRDG
eukprot:9490739-Pyramimonas_sp.AAC.1